MKTRLLFITLCASAAVAAVCQAADTKDIEQAIRNLDDQWSKAAVAKDVDKTVSFYSDDAIVLPPNAPALTTKEGIRNIWKEILTGPGANISWKATRVEIAQSGDMAYSTGTYEYTMKDPSGKPVNDRGKYLEVWKKQKDGSWKCGADMYSSDLPAAPPAEKK